MNYTITPGGIVYDVGQDYQHEERQTDRIADEQPPPIPDDVAVAVVKREAAKIEAWAK